MHFCLRNAQLGKAPRTYALQHNLNASLQQQDARQHASCPKWPIGLGSKVPRLTGMIPILHSPGLMMPGQLGPMRRVFVCSLIIFLTFTCKPYNKHARACLPPGTPCVRLEEDLMLTSTLVDQAPAHLSRPELLQAGRARSLGPNQNRTYHVMLRNAFRNAHNQIQLSLHCLKNCGCSKRGRNVDHAGMAPSHCFGLLDAVENWQVQVLRASFFRSDTPHHLRAVCNGLQRTGEGGGLHTRHAFRRIMRRESGERWRRT